MSEKKTLNIYQKLLAIQTELKAPKNQEAKDFKTGKVRYRYRSCEDILEALKPLLAKHNCMLHITDDINEINGRFYIEAMASLVNTEAPEEVVINRAYARETDDNGRMDAAQITGTASSYARKYALNGLFLIDDTKDVDTDENQEEKENATKEQGKKSEEKKPEEKKKQMATQYQIKKMQEIAESLGKELDEEVIKTWTMKQASDFINQYSKGE